VESVFQRRARVALGVDELVGKDSRVQPTSAEVTQSVFAPPRAAGLWEVSFLARPLLVLDELGAGGMLDASVGYRFRAPLHIEAALAPLAFASAREGAVTPIAGVISAFFDTHYFEIGLGVGAQTVNDPPFALDRGTGLTIAPRMRIGARDGAYLDVSSYVALFHSDFRFSHLRVGVQIPVGSQAWLLAAGGGGTMGLAYAEVGLRLLLSGNGGPGSFFLSTTVGGVSMFDGCNVLREVQVTSESCTTHSYAGPMLGAGGEWRL
jgi:hypothetical protein